MKVILFCPAGRQPVFSIQLQYIKQILDLDCIEEYHIWNFARNQADFDFIESLATFHPKIKILHSPFKQDFSLLYHTVASKQFWFLYNYYTYDTYKDSIFIKLDDDITYVDTCQFEKFVKAREESNAFLLSANIINNDFLKPELFNKIHSRFLLSYRNILQKNRQKSIVPYENTKNLSINFVAFLGRDLQHIHTEFSNGEGWGDELRMCQTIPQKLDRQNEIDERFTVVHYAFGCSYTDRFLDDYKKLSKLFLE